MHTDVLFMVGQAAIHPTIEWAKFLLLALTRECFHERVSDSRPCQIITVTLSSRVQAQRPLFIYSLCFSPTEVVPLDCLHTLFKLS